MSSKSQYQFVVQGIDRDEFLLWANKLADAMGRDPRFTDVTTDVQANALQATVVVDREKASLLGITADQLRNSLYDGFGTNQASTIFKTGDSYEVIVELDPDIPWTADKLDLLQIRSAATGKLVPLSAFARVERTAGLLSVNQLAQLPAVTISFNLPQGRRSAQRPTRSRRSSSGSACRPPCRPASRARRRSSRTPPPTRISSCSRPCSPSMSCSASSTRASSIR